MFREGKALLVGGDLMAKARIVDAAAAAGVTLESVTVERMRAALEGEDPIDLLILDLDQGGQGLLDALVQAREEGLVPRRVIGYLSHVDEKLGKRAQEAGCDALPRGRFWRTLPELLAG